MLLSVEGSGNTWLRFLIERLTGICTGSAYHDRTLLGRGFRCEMGSVYNGQTIVQKAHYIHHVDTTRILHLIRLPLDAALADFHRMKTLNNHTGVAESSAFYGDEWNNFVLTRSGEWLQQIDLVLRTATQLHVVFYENLRANLTRELIHIADFLRVHVSPERLQCVVANPTGKAKRQRISQDPSYFTKFHRDMASLAVARAVALLHQGNIPNIPDEYLKTANQVRSLLLPRVIV